MAEPPRIGQTSTGPQEGGAGGAPWGWLGSLQPWLTWLWPGLLKGQHRAGCSGTGTQGPARGDAGVTSAGLSEAGAGPSNMVLGSVCLPARRCLCLALPQPSLLLLKCICDWGIAFPTSMAQWRPDSW